MTIAVIGAGLQGCLAAIELSGRGHDVVVFEREPGPLTRASRWNEGKIHLGYLYANDPSLRTARTLVDGATTFAPLLGRYLERDPDFLGSSSAFVYAVHRASLLTPDAFAAHLDRAHALVAEALGRGDRNYLGATSLAPPRAAAVDARGLDASSVLAAFDTGERSIDARRLTEAVAHRLAADPRVTLVTGTDIAAINRRDDGGFDLTGSDGAPQGAYSGVVNCAWERRLGLDATLGYRPDIPWLHRYKVALHVDAGALDGDVPSVTVVLGPFGDVVNFGAGRLYLSWYPAARVAATMELVPPSDAALAEAARRDGLAETMVGRLAAIVPAVATLELTPHNAQLQGGFIFAWGRTDISDRESGLHSRYDIGVHSDRGYHSIDTGKLTMAPLYATVLGERVGDAPPRKLRRIAVEAAQAG